jgi:hypothetical protein
MSALPNEPDSRCRDHHCVTAGEIWKRPHGDGSLRIVTPGSHSAVVEQVERPQDGRWAIN